MVWGNPTVKEEYEYMITYSPYDNVERARNPDDRTPRSTTRTFATGSRRSGWRECARTRRTRTRSCSGWEWSAATAAALASTDRPARWPRSRHSCSRRSPSSLARPVSVSDCRATRLRPRSARVRALSSGCRGHHFAERFCPEICRAYEAITSSVERSEAYTPYQPCVSCGGSPVKGSPGFQNPPGCSGRPRPPRPRSSRRRRVAPPERPEDLLENLLIIGVAIVVADFGSSTPVAPRPNSSITRGLPSFPAFWTWSPRYPRSSARRSHTCGPRSRDQTKPSSAPRCERWHNR